MENEDIIRLAVQITEENNSLYKKAAREQAFMIKAEDGAGTVDTFITVKGSETADQWKNQFFTAGFRNIVVSPFRSSGNLSFSDVDTTFFTEISKRAKWQMTHSPTGLNTPFTDYNPYASEDPISFDATDRRVGSSHSYDSTNKYQEFIDQSELPSVKEKIFAGWFDGSLMDWINKLISIDTSVEEILKKKYAYLYGNAPLQKYLLDKDIDPTKFVPTKFQINSLGINMYSLFDILSHPDIDLDDFPEELIKDDLQDIVVKAKSHKFHKQYQKSDMDNFQQAEIDQQLAKDMEKWKLFTTIMRGFAR